MSMFVKFWGARGSIPTPASWTRVYGGNTSCVEVRVDDTIFICDAGSGIRELGKDLLERNPRPTELHLLITHTHWDHIQGFPFFTPAYLKDMRMFVHGGAQDDNKSFRVLAGQMSSEYFPVSFQDLGANIVFENLDDGHKDINGVRVRGIPLNHPGGCMGYALEKSGCKVVYATDNELLLQPGDAFPDSLHEGGLRHVPEALVKATRGADLLIADAQYDDTQYATKKGWGHSSCLSVVDFAIRAEVKNLALFHHDPESTDHELDSKVELCQRRATKRGVDLVVFAAREGVELKF
jgi:phosphoribosyl 1,2-cyclic phosphodiesterase